MQLFFFFFFFQAEDGIRDLTVTGVQTCALPIWDLRDVLALQAEVAQSIGREIRIKITAADQARIAEVHPVEPDAYEAYLRGRYHWNRRNAEGLGKAMQYFQQAIDCD